MNKEKELAKGVSCPHCGKTFDVVEVKVTVEEPVKGVYEKSIVIRKNPQTTLEEDSEEEISEEPEEPEEGIT